MIEPTKLGDRGRIPGLDGLRAMAILIVVAGHLNVRFEDQPSHRNLLWRMAGSGGIGVDVFFVLSGYLITTLLLREFERHGRIDLGSFYLRRAFRILPAFYLYLSAVALLVPLAGWLVPLRSMVYAGLFLYDYAALPHPWLVGHLWSLAVEEQFYIFWPVLLGTCLSRWGRRGAIRVALALIAFGAAMRCYDGRFAYERFLGRDFMMVHTRVDTLMFGCLFALCSGLPFFERMYTGARRFWWVAPAWFLAAGNLMTRLFGLNFRLYVGMTINGLAIAFFILYVARSPKTWLGRFLGWGPIAYLGVISYSMYLWQEIFTAPENTSWTGRMPGMLLCIALAPVVSFELVEKPVLRLRARWTGRSRTDVVEPRPANR